MAMGVQPIGAGTKDFDPNKDKMGLLANLLQQTQQNPIAAGYMKGAEKGAMEMGYGDVMSGKDPNALLQDLVQRFGPGIPQPQTREELDREITNPSSPVPEMMPSQNPFMNMKIDVTKTNPAGEKPGEQGGAPDFSSAPKEVQDTVKKVEQTDAFKEFGQLPWTQRFAMGYMSVAAPKLFEHLSGKDGGGQMGDLQKIMASEGIKYQFDQIKKAEEEGRDVRKEKRKFFQENILKTPQLSSELIAVKGFYGEVKKDVQELISMFNQNPGVLAELGAGMFRSDESRKAMELLQRIKANYSPARGGKTLTESEIKMVDTLLPKSGIASWAQSQEMAANAMNSLLELSNRQLSNIDPYATHRDTAQQLIQQGYPEDEVINFFSNQGIL